MKIKKGNWKIDLRTLVRFERRGVIPKIIIHEKYEKHVKWILRILSIIGVLTSFLILPYKAGIVVSLIIFTLEQILERVIFEYTVLYIPKFPDFEIKYENWLSTGYFVLNDENRFLLLESNYSFMGPLYEDKDYAEKFFNFMRSWNNNKDIDKENNINVSIIIENEKKYTMYLYPNYNQKELDKYFKKYKEKLALEKYGKKQQEFIMQFVFWHNNLNQGEFFSRFIEDFAISKAFYFVPFYLENGNPQMIEELKVKKTHLKIKRRNQVHISEIEYIYK